MYEFTCKECGQVKQVRRKQELRTFCSVSCASKFNRRNYTHNIDTSYPWKRAKGNRSWICRYNPEGCACEDRNCSECGWNPEVAERRLKEFEEKFV